MRHEIERIAFLDIETVPDMPAFRMLDERFQILWKKKAMQLRRTSARWSETPDTDEDMYDRCAGIYSEFARVIVAAVGCVTWTNNAYELTIRAFAGHEEQPLLRSLASWMNNLPDDVKLCAHNGKEFDFPFLARRMVINRIDLPKHLHLAGRKPWEVTHMDTMDMWRFGDHKNFTSLEQLAALFGIASAKKDLDGSRVRDTYYIQDDLEKIMHYCAGDVETLARVFIRLKNWPVEMTTGPIKFSACTWNVVPEHPIH